MLGEQLARLRKQRGLTQAQVAEALGLPQGLISNFEKGVRRLYVDLLIQFADLYEVSTDELLGRKQRRKVSAEFGLPLVKRMQQIEKLPKPKQKAVLQSIDMILVGAKQKAC